MNFVIVTQISVAIYINTVDTLIYEIITENIPKLNRYQADTVGLR